MALHELPVRETCGLFALMHIYENLIPMHRLTGQIALPVSVTKRL